MRLLALMHGPTDLGVFGDVINETGHELDGWSMLRGTAPRAVDGYGAVIVFGGWMHATDITGYPWLDDERRFLRDLLEQGTPTLGICLGAQLLVTAVGGLVVGASEFEKGWTPVELTDAGVRDPVIGCFPRRFAACNWHVDTWTLPAGDAVELARSSRCSQAFRIGETAWGVQFHPEVTRTKVRAWLETDSDSKRDDEETIEVFDGGMDQWNLLGGALCRAFLEVAEARAGRQVGPPLDLVDPRAELR